MQHDNIKTGRGETMAEDKNSKVTQNQDRINKLIDGLTLFDDDLMSRVFDKNIEATELLLRIILERKIKVISVIGQEEMKNENTFKDRAYASYKEGVEEPMPPFKFRKIIVEKFKHDLMENVLPLRD